MKWLVWHMWFWCWDWGSANNSCCVTVDVCCWWLNSGTIVEVEHQRRCLRWIFQIILSMTSINLQEADQAMRVKDYDLAHHVCFSLLISISNELPLFSHRNMNSISSCAVIRCRRTTKRWFLPRWRSVPTNCNISRVCCCFQLSQWERMNFDLFSVESSIGRDPVITRKWFFSFSY